MWRARLDAWYVIDVWTSMSPQRAAFARPGDIDGVVAQDNPGHMSRDIADSIRGCRGGGCDVVWCRSSFGHHRLAHGGYASSAAGSPMVWSSMM
jgi:hypothetical protein